MNYDVIVLGHQVTCRHSGHDERPVCLRTRVACRDDGGCDQGRLRGSIWRYVSWNMLQQSGLFLSFSLKLSFSGLTRFRVPTQALMVGNNNCSSLKLSKVINVAIHVNKRALFQSRVASLKFYLRSALEVGKNSSIFSKNWSSVQLKKCPFYDSPKVANYVKNSLAQAILK